MKKFIITEEEKKSIRGLYGLNEQTITLPHSVSDTFNSNDGDTAHRLTVFEKKVDKDIEQIYNQGINPKMYDLSFNVVRNGNTFTTTVSLVINKSDDGKAWTGFASRGSYGPGYEKRADDQITGEGNKDGRSLKEKLESGADAVEIIPISNSPITIRDVTIKQYFFQFTKSLKPSHTISKQTPTTPQQPQTNTTPRPNTQQKIEYTKFEFETTDLNTLNADFKEKVNTYIINGGNKNYNVDDYFSISSKDGITTKVKVSLNPDENGYNRFSVLLNEKGKAQESLNNALSKNPGSKRLKNGTITIKNKEYEWHLVGLHV
jgi:hypothetical protein